MVKQTKILRPPDRLLGRLALALLKGTGTRLSPEDVRAFGPLVLAIIRSANARPSRATGAKPLNLVA